MMGQCKLNARMLSRLGSCGAYGMAMLELADSNSNVVAITADLQSFSGLDRFARQYPERIFNTGIAEQDMLGMAGGMAKEGLIPYASSYATFASMRAADQVRVNMGYMSLPVKLVGLTSGLSVGILGPTHICIEDIALLRSFPNITILSPADCVETYQAVLAAADIEGPVYLRLTGTQNAPIVYKDAIEYEVGKAVTLRNGSDVAIIATGTMVYESLQAADILSDIGISAKVVDMHTIVPLDKAAVKDCFSCSLLVTVEEHGLVGGLGSSIAEHFACNCDAPPQLMLGCKNYYEHAGEYRFLLERYGLIAKQIAESIRGAFERR